MSHPHTYQAALTWEGNLGQGTSTYQAYSRLWRVRFTGKPDLLGSADPTYRGETDKHNPEDLLVASLSSCHMLTWLALCARNKITVVSYVDNATGVMETTPDGGGRFVSVTLNPKAEITDGAQKELAERLHQKAHELCFIAASVNFPVHHAAEVVAPERRPQQP
ncbi:MAG TPA: OsmC family protein [Spirochaetia bacterium]|nr:OsmC family protein [Spirochaetia bacterium]